QDLSKDEEQLIENAKNLVEFAKENLVRARTDWYVIPGNKEKAIATADEAVKTAELGVTNAMSAAEAARRERLANMSMEQLMQQQLATTQELIDMASGR